MAINWQRMKTLREGVRLSQGGLSRSSGVSQGYISQLEAKMHTPTVDIALRLANALDVPLDVLLIKVGYRGFEVPDADEIIKLRRRLAWYEEQATRFTEGPPA
ncbi:hypothetical protein LCGC14_1798650 [marine sediment metagenome]|uniref:HTH cro/C1-type domain-containing protein n=1 Tax=marine sediment metagenome TaxID=412755 RepID=A0A0F9HD05_9ZZZZ